MEQQNIPVCVLINFYENIGSPIQKNKPTHKPANKRVSFVDVQKMNVKNKIVFFEGKKTMDGPKEKKFGIKKEKTYKKFSMDEIRAFKDESLRKLAVFTSELCLLLKSVSVGENNIKPSELDFKKIRGFNITKHDLWKCHRRKGNDFVWVK